MTTCVVIFMTTHVVIFLTTCVVRTGESRVTSPKFPENSNIVARASGNFDDTAFEFLLGNMLINDLGAEPSPLESSSGRLSADGRPLFSSRRVHPGRRGGPAGHGAGTCGGRRRRDRAAVPDGLLSLFPALRIHHNFGTAVHLRPPALADWSSPPTAGGHRHRHRDAHRVWIGLSPIRVPGARACPRTGPDRAPSAVWVPGPRCPSPGRSTARPPPARRR